MHSLLILLFTFSSISQTYSDSTTVESTVKNVTVFRSQAQIERTAEVQLNAGKNVVIFTELSPSMITNSIQLKGKGTFTLLSITNKNNFFEVESNNNIVTRLTAKRDSLQRKISSSRAHINVINSSISLLNSSANIANNHKLTAAELDALLDLNSRRLLDFEEQKLDINSLIQELNSEIRLLNNRIREFGSTTRTRFKEVIAEIEMESARSMEFSLQYLVNNAGWNPSYDIRSEDINEPMEISYKAKIYQNTGYDWNDVNFTINSGDPSQNIQKPELSPKFVGFYRDINTNTNSGVPSTLNTVRTANKGVISGTVVDRGIGETIPGATVLVKPLNKGVATDDNGSFQLRNIPNGSYTLEIAFVGYNTLRKTISISNSGLSISAFLGATAFGLDELVVSGYSVSPDLQNERKIFNGDDASSAFKTQIRGNGSINAVSEALYVIDGVVAPNISMNEIDPDDIESLEVLKDAEAVALYGERAAAGVVIITTKSKLGRALENQFISNQTSFSYKIERPYSIPADGKEHLLDIKNETPETNYLYATVPKLSTNAFLIGTLSNWNDLNLIEGDANVYFENSFVGNTYLDPSSLRDTLEISLGKDERIIVERKKLKDFEERRFFGSKTRESLSYEISIRNTKSESIEIIVEDQIPVSTDEDIKVTEKELTGGSLNKQTGIITWRLKLAPNETRKLKMNFQIEYPKGKRISY